MSLETRKIAFIQEFIKLQNEEIITLFEGILKMAKTDLNDQLFKPMSQEELERRIDQSELDFENGNHKSSSELIAKFK
jgi:hypothetical protein